MLLEKKELKELLKEKNVKTLDDFNSLMGELSREVMESLLEGEILSPVPFSLQIQRGPDV